MSDRKAELERKKAKLQAMRDEKRRKEEEKRKKEGIVTSAVAPKPELIYVDKQTCVVINITLGKTYEIVAMLKEQLEKREAGDSGTNLRTEADEVLKSLGISTAAPPAQPAGAPNSLAHSTASTPAASVVENGTTSRSRLNLQVSKVTQTNIAPKENVTYSKETQTNKPEPPEREGSPRHSVHSYGSLHGSPRHNFVAANLEWDDEFTYADDDESIPDGGSETPPVSAARMRRPPLPSTAEEAPPAEKKEVKPEPPRELTDDEKTKILSSEDFGQFMSKSSRLIERAMDEVNIFTDYGGDDDLEKDSGLAEGERLKLSRQFYDERWSRHRTVTCLDWSQQYPELLVTSYNNNEESPHEPDGVVLVWNMKYKKETPEYIFHCQSAVMSTCFAKFHPNLIVGGTYSGQIALWDNRSNKRTPVQRTPLSATAHTHPVYCVNVVGTQNAHNLISVSTDGKMCSWSLDMLSQPQDSSELTLKSKSVAVMCMSFLSGDVNNYVVGTEECSVYSGCRHGSKAGLQDVFEGHFGPITGVDCHSAAGQIDFSHYFLTTSFDWTIKLWNVKETKPLASFEVNSDYVCDSRWSPTHPALFAAVDCSGRLDLWNLNMDTEVPIASATPDPAVGLNRVRWQQNGAVLSAGDDQGRVYVYDVNEALAVPKSDEWTRLMHTFQDLKTEKAEQEDVANTTSTTPLR